MDDPPGHQAYMEVPEGLAGFAETDKPSYVLISDDFSHIEYHTIKYIMLRNKKNKIFQQNKRLNIIPDNFIMRTALITGITGQDGSYLAEFLLEKGL